MIIDLALWGKRYCGLLSQIRRDTATHQRRSNVTGLISDLIGVKVKNSLGAINY